MEVAYEDFSLWIEPDGSGYRVKARSSAGEDSDRLEIPDDPELFLKPFAELARSAVPAVARDLRHAAAYEHRLGPDEIGDRLFQALFTGRVRQLFERSCGSRSDRDRGLRVKLHLGAGHDAIGHDAVARLCNLPWELLYRRETRDHLGFNRLTPIVRYLDLARPNQPVPFAPPLRILVVTSNPEASSALNLEKERGLIEAAWPPNDRVKITVLERANLERIHETLCRGPFHVVHFMGHGTFDEANGAGSLLLEGSNGEGEMVRGEVFANVLKGHLPHLVVVNACQSAQVTSERGRDFFAGVATALVLAGLPAVVAMRVPILDSAAVTFSKTFYRELAVEQPVDAAVAEARLAIYRGDPSSAEWATPVLFMRVPDGRLFAAASETSPAQPAHSDDRSDLVQLKVGDLEVENAEIGNQIGACAAALPGRIQVDAGRIVGKGTFQIFNRKNVQ